MNQLVSKFDPRNSVTHLHTVHYKSAFDLIFLCIGYKLAIICSNEDEERSHIVAQLQNYRRPYSAMSGKTDFQEYLLHHFKTLPEVAVKEEDVASVVDPDRSG